MGISFATAVFTSVLVETDVSGLETTSVHYVQAVRTESRSKCQFGSN